jgi:hypothetical protein
MIKEKNIDDATPNFFQHKRATRAAMDGIEMDKIATFLGGTMATVEKNYKHLSPDYLPDALNL